VADAFLDSLNLSPASDQEEESTSYRIKKAIYLWGQVSSDIIIAVFTGMLVIVAWGQKRIYARQAEIIEKGLAATEEAAKAASLSANLAKTALQLSERADVLVDKMGMDSKAPISVGSKVIVELRNFGRTTAKKVRTELHFKTKTGVQNASKPLALAAGQPVTIMAEILPADWTKDDLFNYINSGNDKFIVGLSVYYDDTFGFSHTVEYMGTLAAQNRQFDLEITKIT
jgi:hypothetical protein